CASQYLDYLGRFDVW
nr:immunoglobulin heavy chain junction region [Macaca mulatta]